MHGKYLKYLYLLLVLSVGIIGLVVSSYWVYSRLKSPAFVKFAAKKLLDLDLSIQEIGISDFGSKITARNIIIYKNNTEYKVGVAQVYINNFFVWPLRPKIAHIEIDKFFVLNKVDKTDNPNKIFNFREAIQNYKKVIDQIESLSILEINGRDKYLVADFRTQEKELIYIHGDLEVAIYNRGPKYNVFVRHLAKPELNFSLGADLTKNEIAIENLSLIFKRELLEGAGKIQLDDDGYLSHLDLDLRANNFNIGDLFDEFELNHEEFEFEFSGNINFLGTELSREVALTCFSVGEIFDFRLYDLHKGIRRRRDLIIENRDSLAYELEVGFSKDKLNFTKIKLTDSLQTELMALGELKLNFESFQSSYLNLEILALKLNFKTIKNHIDAAVFDAHGIGGAVLYGKLAELKLMGFGSLNSVRVENYFFPNLTGHFDFQERFLSLRSLFVKFANLGAGGDGILNGTFDIDFSDDNFSHINAQALGLKLTDLIKILPEEKYLLPLGRFFSGKFNGDFALSGKLKKKYLKKLQINCLVESGELKNLDLLDEPVRALKTQIALINRSLRVDVQSLNWLGGKIEGFWKWHLDTEEVLSDFVVKDLDLSRAKIFQGMVVGLASGFIRLKDNFKSLGGSSQFSIRNIALEHKAYPEIILASKLDKGIVEFKTSRMFDSLKISGDLELFDKNKFSLFGSLSSGNFQNLLSLFNLSRSLMSQFAPKIGIDFNLELHGNLFSQKSYYGVLSLMGLDISLYDYNFLLSDQVALKFKDMNLELPMLILTTKDSDNRVTLFGKISEHSNHAVLKIQLEEKNIKRQINWHNFGVFRLLGGKIFLQAALSQSMYSPRIELTVDTRQSEIWLEAFETLLSRVTLKAVYEEGNFDIQKLLIVAGGGSFDAKGSLNEGVFGKLINFPLSWPQLFSVDLNGNLDFTAQRGIFDFVNISGEVSLDNLRIIKEIDLDLLLKQQQEKIEIYLLNEASWWKHRLNVALTSNKSKMENSMMDMDFNLSLELLGDINNIGLLGELRFGSGNFYFSDNRFDVSKALITFQDKNKIEWNFDIEAESKIEGYDIWLRAFGSPSRPKMILNSDPRLSDEEIISLLTAGVLGSNLKNISDLATGAGVELLSWVTGVNQGLYDLLPDLLKNREMINIRSLQLKSQKNYLEVMPKPAVLMGLDLTNGLKLRIESSFFDSKSSVLARKLELEQYLTPSLRWRVVWENQDDMPIGDAGMDLWYSWEF